MMKLFGIVLALAATALAGCSTLSCGDPHPYLNSGTRPPLTAPAGVSVPAPDPAYEIAGASVTAGKRTDLNAAGACLINPPQVVPSAAAGSTRQADMARSESGAATPASKSEVPAKPASKRGTPAPAAGTSVPVL